MNLRELKSIINSNLSDEVIKSKIINTLAKDENIIPIVMKILERERQFKKEMVFTDGNFIKKEIVKFYAKYKGYVGNYFKSIFFFLSKKSRQIFKIPIQRTDKK